MELVDPGIQPQATQARLPADFFRTDALLSVDQQSRDSADEPEHQKADSRDSDNVDRMFIVVWVKAHGASCTLRHDSIGNRLNGSGARALMQRPRRAGSVIWAAGHRASGS
jgi:hypothetical protein